MDSIKNRKPRQFLYLLDRIFNIKSDVTVGFLLFFYRVFYDKKNEDSVGRIFMFIGKVPKIGLATGVAWTGTMYYLSSYKAGDFNCWDI